MFTLEKKVKNTSDEILEKVRQILFPPPTTDSHFDEEGKERKWQVCYDLDWNLEAALLDLQEGHNDQPVHNTINGVIKSLIKIRDILEEHMALDPDAEYIMVESAENKIDDKELER